MPLIHLVILYRTVLLTFACALLSLLLRLGLDTLSIRRSIEVMSRSCNMPLKNTFTLRPFVSMLYKAKCPGICHHTNAFSFAFTAQKKEPLTSQLIFLKRKKVCLHCVLDLCTSVAIVRIGHTFTSHHMFFTDSV